MTMFVAALSVGAWLGRFHWLGDLLAMPARLYAGIALVLLVAAAVVRAWRWAALALVVALLNTTLMGAYGAIRPAPTAAADGPRNLRLLVYNIYHLNPDIQQVVATVRQYDPDIVFLMEYSDAIQPQIEPAFADYPYQLVRTSRFTMGLALFSRIPFERTEIHRAEATRIPVFQADMQLDGVPFTFVGGHPWPPQPQWGQLHRNQTRAILDVAAQAPGNLIVAGDFNAVPWSFMLNELERTAGVRNIRQKLEWANTWRPSPLFSLPIDHVFVSDMWQVRGSQYGDPHGSDHVPIVVDLVLGE